jgi:tRNA 2-thiocytidine biosynthesis protein TtcA
MAFLQGKEFYISKRVGRAIMDYQMFSDGDKIAVAVSGGKDSLSLLRLLDERRRSVPERYELVALHVPGDGSGPCQPHPPLMDWLQAGGYEHHLAPFELSEGESLPLDCQRCTHHRRRALFFAAQQVGCNVVAFGHHADDLAQTTLLNLIYSGVVETMAPRRDYFEGALRLIRPLCYVPEADLRRFARACDFPLPPPSCPQAETSRRCLAAELLREVQHAAPAARTNLLRAGLKGLKV